MSRPTAFDTEDMELLMEGDGVEVRRASAGDEMTLVYIRCPAGFDFGPALEGLPHDMCPCEHWGTILEGRMDITTHDGQELTLSEGEAFHLLPGHSPEFPEDCSWYEFTPTEQADRLFAHMGLG
ncbi:MAG: hypothetical protein R3199_04730 [Gemmatimonadota bacterium]|nr:hypothetical protein [Gemmatimonadota bacterium]